MVGHAGSKRVINFGRCGLGVPLVQLVQEHQCDRQPRPSMETERHENKFQLFVEYLDYY